MPEQLSRNAELVHYFAAQYGGVPRTVLVKFIYMADLIAREYLGEPISSFVYHLDRHGPYDAAIEIAVAELVSAGMGWEDTEHYVLSNGKPGRYKRLYINPQPASFSFSLGQNEVLAYVTKNYVPMPKDELLLEVVYQTPPMKAVNELMEPLPMEMVDNVGRKQVGFELEEVLEAEGRAQTEPLLTLNELMSAVQTSLSE